MGEFNIITTKVEAISRKEWLKNRRSERAQLSIGSANSVSGSQLSPVQGGGTATTSLSALTDVKISELGENHLLVFDGESWRNISKDSFLEPVTTQLEIINSNGDTEGSVEWKILQTLKWKTLNP